MCFNLGVTRLGGFVNTLAAMKRGDYEAAADGMMKSLWASQVGRRAQRLAKMMREG
jgi:lysozyme